MSTWSTRLKHSSDSDSTELSSFSSIDMGLDIEESSSESEELNSPHNEPDFGNIDSDSESNDDEVSYCRLACHPFDQIPKIATCAMGKLFHPECLVCSKCKSQLKPPYAFTLITQAEIKLLCMKCAEKMDKSTHVCEICQSVINSLKHCKELKKGYFVHKDCIHCEVCSRSRELCKNFTVIEDMKGGNHIVCEDCVALMNGNDSPNPVDVIIGRFIPNIKSAKYRNNCQRCINKLQNDVFVYTNSTLLCADCGTKTLLASIKK